MDHRFLQQNPSERSRYAGGFARRLIARGHVEGNGYYRNKMSGLKMASDARSGSGSPLEGHSGSFEPWQDSSDKSGGTPMKALIHEELSRENKVCKSSPSVIAKLMGLDSLPPPQTAAKQQKETRSNFPKTTYTSYPNHSFGLGNGEHQEFKDVFEIKDSAKRYKYRNQPVLEGNSHMKQDDNDVAFIRQKFMEAKRLSTDEHFQNSKEFNEALEVLDTNRDLFLKFLEEPNSLSRKHLQDLKGFSPIPHESHITILKSSKGKTYDIDGGPCKSQTKFERRPQVQKDPISSLRQPTANLFNHLLQEHSGSLSHALKAQYAGKTGSSHRSTKIVVLKPNLEKLQDNARNISQPSSHDDHLFGCRRYKEFQHSGIQELHTEGRERQNLFDNVEVLGQRTKGSREIAREMEKQISHSVNCASDRMLASRFHRYIKDETPCFLGGRYQSNQPAASQKIPDNVEYRNSTLSPSASCSTESSVSREARKRLSERWRMTNRIQQARLASKGSSTLGEMLHQFDIEIPRAKTSPEKLARGMHETQFYPSGISSKDGWKDECSKNLPRYSSPATSRVHVTSKSSRQQIGEGGNCYMLKDVLNLGVVDSSCQSLNQSRHSLRKSFKSRSYNPHLDPGGEENKLPEKEIHMNQEEPKTGNQISEHAEVNPTLSRFSDSNVANSSNLVDSSVKDSTIVEMPLTACEGHVQQSAQEGESSAMNDIDEIIEERSASHSQIVSVSSECGRKEPGFFLSSNNAEKPSPISVLPNPSEEGQSSPECFEKVSAGLRELRTQLRLLRLESDSYNTDSETPCLSEDGSEPCNVLPYGSGDDRDYSYLLEALRLLKTHNSPKPSLDPDTFEKLEEKYGMIAGWSKSERKLYFDLIGSIVGEMLSPKRKLVSVLGCDGLIDEAWQKVVRLRKEHRPGKSEANILDPNWLDVGGDVGAIGCEIEGILMDDLLEEFVSQFITDD